MSETVKVAVRCRPLNDKEKNEEKVVEVKEKRKEIFLYNKKKDQTKQFTFDFVYSEKSSQIDIYQDCAYGIIESVIEGYNGTIFAYGQTGTGKTFTMEGIKNNENLKGIIPRAFEQVFNTIEGTDHTEFLVTCSMLELYNENVYDLLSKEKGKKLKVREKPGSGFFVKDLLGFDLQSDKECIELLEKGSSNRHKASTEMNKDSSRSHCIFTITIETSIKDEKGNNLIRKGKLNLVDLAGSERQKKTQVKVGGKRMKEAQKINFSLGCLGKVISCLVKNAKFIPYRDSKLTKLLTDSLGGNTKTVMIANIGPAGCNYDESICTLRYANQAKNIKNKPIINEDPKDAKLRQIQDEITKLKEYLKNVMGKNVGNILEGDLNKNKKLVLKQIMKEKEKGDEKYRDETEKIMKMKKISEEERKRLLDELHKHEQEENKKREEKQKLIEKITQAKNKIIQGDKKKEEFLKIQKELIKKRKERQLFQEKKQKLKEKADDAEIEKGQLEQKYVSQKQELKEKEKLQKKIKKRYLEINGNNDEIVESFNIEKKELEEENADLENQINTNELIISSYFDKETIKKLNESLSYTPYYDMYKFNENSDSDLKAIFDSFVHIKEIQEKDFHRDVDENQENILLLGHQNPFFNFSC